MKKIITLVIVSSFLSIFCQAQNSGVSIKLGPGMITDYIEYGDFFPGFHVGLEYKPFKAPIVLYPYLNHYYLTGEDRPSDVYSRRYYGAIIMFSKNLSKGLYFGVGGGIAYWIEDRNTSIRSPSISPILGYRFRLSNNLSFLTETQLFFNTKYWTEPRPVGAFCIDNDVTVRVGVSYTFLHW